MKIISYNVHLPGNSSLPFLPFLPILDFFFKFKDVYGVWSVFLFQQLFTIILMYLRQKTLSYVCVIV